MSTVAPAAGVAAFVALTAAARRAAAATEAGGLRVEPVRRAALPELLEIEAASFDSPMPASYFADYVAHACAYGLRAPDGRLTGYFLLKMEEDRLLLTRMGVRPELRGRGAGGLFMRWARALAAELGRTAVLHVRESNEGAIRLYQSCGYATTARVEGFYREPRPEAALRMESLP